MTVDCCVQRKRKTFFFPSTVSCHRFADGKIDTFEEVDPRGICSVLQKCIKKFKRLSVILSSGRMLTYISSSLYFCLYYLLGQNENFPYTDLAKSFPTFFTLLLSQR